MANTTSPLGSPMPTTPNVFQPQHLLSPFLTHSFSDYTQNLECDTVDDMFNDDLSLLHATPPIDDIDYPPYILPNGKHLRTPYSQMHHSDSSLTFTGVHTPMGTPYTPYIASPPVFDDVAIIQQHCDYRERDPLPSLSPEISNSHSLLLMITDDSPKAPSGYFLRNLFASYLSHIGYESIFWSKSIRLVDYIDVTVVNNTFGPLLCFLSSSVLVIYNENSHDRSVINLSNALVLDGNMSISVNLKDKQNGLLLKFDKEYKYFRWKLALQNPQIMIPNELMTCITSFDQFM